MPFLLPAVSSAACDLTVLILAYKAAGNYYEDEDEAGRLVYQSGYMVAASCTRLFLLICPLPYHSYNGTALKCPALYRALYFGTLVVLLGHALLLCLVDPRSLSSMVPSINTLTLHEQVTRHIWFLLILSLAADFCHILLFLHVRSTAPAEAELVPARPKVLFYYVKEKEDTERDNLLPGLFNGRQSHLSSEESASASSMQQISSRVVAEVQNRLQHAKDEWTKRLADYRLRTGGTSSQDLIHRPLTAFRVLLQLFAYEDVLTNGRLDAVYNQDNGATLLNFVPQLLSFLLHGAFESSTRLEKWILSTCRQNIYFAHRCYWFLRAWSLESKKMSSGDPVRLSSASSLASFENSDTITIRGRDDKSQKSNGNLLPEERAVIEELLHQVMKCGEEPARRLFFGNGLQSENGESLTMETSHTSPSALMLATESGAIPVDPLTGIPSAKHWDCVAASRKYGFLPLDDALTNHQRESKAGFYESSYFDSTPVFLDALLNIAEELFLVPREDRTREFHRQLRLLEVQALPSNAIYIPLQDVNHRVWRIVVDESIAIGTKERVPCIICLEVVEYPPEEAPQTRDVRHLLSRVAPQDSQLTFPDLVATQSEKDLIKAWRHGYRDPHRRDTPFEKIASQMRQGMKKIQLDQVKTSVKAQIDKVKNTNLQEFLSLSIPNTYDEDEENDDDDEPLHTIEPMPSRDIERGEPLDVVATPSKPVLNPRTVNSQFVPSDSPKSSPSPTKKAIMGQWTPPPKLTRSREVNLSPTFDDIFVPPRLQHRSYQRMEESDNVQAEEPKAKSRFGSCLPKAHKNTDDEGEAGTKPSIKPPPVVFKENWKEKEDRIRASSIYGSHPGWRLLPILIKANDDLRQEQLASQLIYRISVILARERIPVWLCPYEILALTENGGIIEAIPDTISISSLKKNDPNYTSLKGFFHKFFEGSDNLADAKANFCESLAGYSMVCFLLQMKDRHNGNILLDNRGHLIHIDFGFFFLSSPGKNSNWESAPFKLTREFVDVLDGPDSRLFRIFRTLCYRAFIALRRHCMEIILLVEMLKKGNEDLPCFRGRPDDAISELRHRFRLDLNDRACLEYVNALIDESLENWRTNWYDRYQRYCVGVL